MSYHKKPKNYLTAKELADKLCISEEEVQNKKGIEKYFMGYDLSGDMSQIPRDELVTIKEISEIVGVSEDVVKRKENLWKYFIRCEWLGGIDFLIFYYDDVLRLWEGCSRRDNDVAKTLWHSRN